MSSTVHRIRKSFTYEAAHILESAFTEACWQCVHGHSYMVEMFIVSGELDEDEMVLDFSKLKRFKEKVMAEWDHGLILHEDKRQWFQPLIDAGVLKREKVCFLSVNPTAEAMARILFKDLRSHLLDNYFNNQRGLRVEKVRVHETSTGWAEFGEEP